jgi:hypothetical protein
MSRASTTGEEEDGKFKAIEDEGCDLPSLS